MVSTGDMGGQVPSTYLGALRAGLDAGPQLGKRERKAELAGGSSQHTYSGKLTWLLLS